MANKTAEHGLFHVGDRVRFVFGLAETAGTIVEDRGAIGVGGRRLYGVRFAFSEGDPMYIELPESDLKLDAASSKVAGKRDT
jgi:hypothetical protein